MQLASHGARAIARNAPTTARSIHIPAAARPQATHLGYRLLTHTRLALTRFIGHLTTPGTGTVSAARSFHAVNPSIQQRLSFTARTTLARPLAPQFLPRAPVVPRTMTQVGLGTARNFSSGRPLFQQLADNVPIAGRAFYEADWDLDSPKERLHRKRPSKKAAAVAAHSKELLKPTAAKKAQVTLSAPAEESATELNRYFAVPAAEVTTYLLVPLAPTPTARAPLPEFPSGRLPLPALLAMHNEHDTHALRVSSLFHRLDTADVWSRGAVCSAYASSADARGVCTILKVEFVGWSKAAVRGVLGESGTGWCVLEETAADAYDADGEDADAFSETSSILSGMASPRGVLTPPEIDPAQSFVLPTLDFSSSFLAASGASATASWSNNNPSPAPRDLFGHSNASTDSDLGAWSDSDDASSIAFIDPPSENGWFERRFDNANANPWLDDLSDSDSDASLSGSGSVSDGGWTGLGLGFSSEFGRRMAATPEPLESAFA